MDGLQHYTIHIQKTAMPELYSSMSEEPKIHIFYAAPGHEVLTPEQVDEIKPETVTTSGGAAMLKISPSILLKRGSHASLLEAKSMLFVAEKRPLIPVPKLYAAYAYGPFDRDLGDYGSVYDTYLFMEFVEGQTLEKAWSSYDGASKARIAAELKRYMRELHSIPAPDYIGSVDKGHVTDFMFQWSTPSRGWSVLCLRCLCLFPHTYTYLISKLLLILSVGPFDSEKEFNAAIADGYINNVKGYVGPYVRELLNSHKHKILFAHGDFRPTNIIIKDGHVAAIIDWEMAGWYPEYWEFAKALFVDNFVTDWETHVLDILSPYYCEQLMYSNFMEVLRW